MNKAYFLSGSATIRLSGFARIIDENGNIIKEINLDTLKEIDVTFNDVNQFQEGCQCGFSIHFDDIFSAPLKETT